MLLGRSWDIPRAFLRRFGALLGHLGLASDGSLDVFSSCWGWLVTAFPRRSVKTQLQTPISIAFFTLFSIVACIDFSFYFLFSVITLAILQLVCLHKTVVAQQVGDSCPTSIFLRMASVL